MRERLRAWFGKRTAPLAVACGMDYARQPDPRWQVMLDEMSPPDPNVSRLVVRWDAGDAWQPIHRWFVWQVQPWHLVPENKQRGLEGPNPRATGSLVWVPMGYGEDCEYRPRWERPTDPNAPADAWTPDRRTWELYRQLKAEGIHGLPTRYWCVQGPSGGQPYKVTGETEARMAAMGTPHRAPAERDAEGFWMPGAEPAEFDTRVIKALDAYDLRRYMDGLGGRADALLIASLRRQQAEERAERKRGLQRYQDIAEANAPLIRHQMRQEGWHRVRMKPVGWKPEAVDYAKADDEYLNTLNTEIPA